MCTRSWHSVSLCITIRNSSGQQNIFHYWRTSEKIRKQAFSLWNINHIIFRKKSVYNESEKLLHNFFSLVQSPLADNFGSYPNKSCLCRYTISLKIKRKHWQPEKLDLKFISSLRLLRFPTFSSLCFSFTAQGYLIGIAKLLLWFKILLSCCNRVYLRSVT
jgi:hypothetical protein